MLLFPLGLFIGLLIKLSDGRSVFYGQTRIGQFGKPFRIWKFRSMRVDADKTGALLTGGGDPRVTAIGSFLRRTKLDELPQLWNVLKGEMSFVGPRPEVPTYIEHYTAEQRRILEHKPGITDAATLLFRNEEQLLSGSPDVEGFYLSYCLPKKLELNRQYAQQATLLHDVWIILRTIFPYWLGILVTYAAALTFCFWLCYQVRSDFRPAIQDYEEFRRSLLLMVLPQLVLLGWRGQLRASLNYFSIPEMRETFLALGVAVVCQAGLSYSLHGRLAPPGALLLTDFIFSFFILSGLRIGLRLLRERVPRAPSPLPRAVRRVALIGTGELATDLVLECLRSNHPVRRVVAYFDDDPRTWQTRPHNIPVIGMPECLLNPAWRDKLDEVIVALPAEESARIQEISEMLKDLPLTVTIASPWPTLTIFRA